MTIFKRVRDALPDWPWKEETLPAALLTPPPPDGGAGHLDLARESLRQLLQDSRVPEEVRQGLAADYETVAAMLEKLDKGEVHILAFGRVGVGKSALLNALAGEQHFSVSPLHGETQKVQGIPWKEASSGGVCLIDSPGLNEVDGEAREKLAREAAARADLILFVIDGDLTASEMDALAHIAAERRPLLLVLNKADRYTRADIQLLEQVLAERTEGLILPGRLIAAAADPMERIYILEDDAGNEVEQRRKPPPDVAALRAKLWEVMEAEGKTLAALNASLFAGRLSDQVAARVVAVKRDVAETLVRTYCVGKGVAVAFNPLPLADLLSVAADAALVIHLGRLYGMEIEPREAGSIIGAIVKQMALLMSAVYGTHLLSSLLKGVSLGASIFLTATTQGAAAYYGTYVVGRAAEQYFIRGRSWGEGGPKRVVEEILGSLDRNSLLEDAKAEILARLSSHK